MGFPNWAKNILFLLVYMISGLVLVIIIEGLISGTDLIPLNTAVEQVMAHLRTPLMTSLMVLLTKIGNPFALFCVALFISTLLFIRGKVYEAALFLAAMGLAVISLTVLKNVFQISRPISEIYQTDGWSFPSGHATLATTFFFMLSHVFLGRLKTMRGRTGLILGSIAGVFIISFSRLYLGAHWILDVIGGLALGLMSVSFVILLFSVFIDENRSVRKRLNM
jgi:membrane-associated phospholipid phosphatase